jgi:hypothetical protein
MRLAIDSPVTVCSPPATIIAWIAQLQKRRETVKPEFRGQIDSAIAEAKRILAVARQLEPGVKAVIGDTKYPPDLFEHVDKRLTELYGPERVAQDELRWMLDACFRASMITDEGREVFFRVVLTEPSRLGEREPYRLEQFIPLNRPLLSTPDAIAKLAQALAYADEIVVCQYHIWGIRRAAPAWWRLYAQLGMLAPAVAFPTRNWRPAIAVRNDGPGQLHVSAEDRPIGALDAGMVFSPPESTCPVLELFKGTDAELRSRFGDWLEVQSSRLMLDVLARVARRRHGGSVVVVSSAERRIPDRVKVKYELEWTALWQRLCDVGENAARVATFATTPFLDKATGQKHYPRLDTSVEYRALQAKLDQSIDAVEHEIRFLAGMSAVDGAIILTDRFEALGFGAELIVGDSPGGDVLLHGHDWSNKPQRRRMDESGMRHRSMYKFIADHPTAVGFVVSQDGGVKGVQQANTDVHVWADLGSH